jgi:drug/metabolite transporter (DMT)-like permease
MSGADLGYLIAFLSMFIGSMSTFPFTEAAREWGSVATNHYRLITALIVLTPLCMVFDKVSIVELFSSSTLMQFALLSSSGIIGLVIGDYFAFHSMAILGAKQSSIFNTLAPGAALLFGYLVLGENINILGIIGVAVSIGGMIWFLKGSGDAEDKAINVHEYGSLRKGIIFGILSGLAQGFHITLSKKGLMMAPHLSAMHATWIRVFAAAVAYFIFTAIQGKFKSTVVDVIRAKKQVIPKATYASIFGMMLSVILVMWCVTLCEVSVAQTILSLGPIILVPAAYLLYKERISLQSIFAAIVSIGGVFILIWRNQIMLWMNLH